MTVSSVAAEAGGRGAELLWCPHSLLSEPSALSRLEQSPLLLLLLSLLPHTRSGNEGRPWGRLPIARRCRAGGGRHTASGQQTQWVMTKKKQYYRKMWGTLLEGRGGGGGVTRLPGFCVARAMLWKRAVSELLSGPLLFLELPADRVILVCHSIFCRMRPSNVCVCVRVCIH